MLDDLRNSANTPFEEEEQSPTPVEVVQRRPARPREPFLGMTSGQRLVIAILLFVMVCVLGMMFLFVTGKIYF
jgi:hypothetical protein